TEARGECVTGTRNHCRASAGVVLRDGCHRGRVGPDRLRGAGTFRLRATGGALLAAAARAIPAAGLPRGSLGARPGRAWRRAQNCPRYSAHEEDRPAVARSHIVAPDGDVVRRGLTLYSRDFRLCW